MCRRPIRFFNQHHEYQSRNQLNPLKSVPPHIAKKQINSLPAFQAAMIWCGQLSNGSLLIQVLDVHPRR